MTLLTQQQCCSLLGIDPKTLRRWLILADISFLKSPIDARRRCLTEDHLQYLATIHDRPWPSSLAQPARPKEAAPPQESSLLASSIQGANELQESTESQGVSEANLNAQLAHLQHVVATLQEHLSQLALELLHERKERETRQQHVAQALISSQPRAHFPTPLTHTQGESLASTPQPPRSSSRKGQPRQLIPLISSEPDGSYLVICPQHGELRMQPDSREWFAWLATLTSFRFIGKLGRLSTSRKPGRSCWMAYRRIHKHRFTYTLGSTEQLTIAHLEHMAALLQSHLTSR